MADIKRKGIKFFANSKERWEKEIPSATKFPENSLDNCFVLFHIIKSACGRRETANPLLAFVCYQQIALYFQVIKVSIYSCQIDYNLYFQAFIKYLDKLFAESEFLKGFNA